MSSESSRKYLLSNTSDKDMKRFFDATQDGNIDEVSFFLTSFGPEVVKSKDRNGWTALFFACESGHGEITSLLLGAGADIHTRDRRGETALSLAIIGWETSLAPGFVRVISILLQHTLNSISADPEAREKSHAQLVRDVWRVLKQRSDERGSEVRELAKRILMLLLANNASYVFDILYAVRTGWDEYEEDSNEESVVEEDVLQTEQAFEVLLCVLRECVNMRETVDRVCGHFFHRFHRGRTGGGAAFMNQAILEVLGEVPISNLLYLLQSHMDDEDGSIEAVQAVIPEGEQETLLARLEAAFADNMEVQSFVEERLRPLM